jgi:hypothetical protein
MNRKLIPWQPHRQQSELSFSAGLIQRWDDKSNSDQHISFKRRRGPDSPENNMLGSVAGDSFRISHLASDYNRGISRKAFPPEHD